MPNLFNTNTASNSTYDQQENGYGYKVNFCGNEITAHLLSDHSQVGQLLIMEGEEDEEYCWLSRIEVSPMHQRKGVGSNLVQVAQKFLPLFLIACVKESAAYTYCLTPDGEALIKACLKKWIIKQSQLKGSGVVPLEGSTSGDPGYSIFGLVELGSDSPLSDQSLFSHASDEGIINEPPPCPVRLASYAAIGS